MNSHSPSHSHPFILLPCPKKLTPHIIKKKAKYMEWDSTVTQLIMEQLANQMPQSCICPNILFTLEIIIPKMQIMVESPSIRFVRYCWTVAVWCNKTIAAYEMALADDIIQAFFNGGSRQNSTVSLPRLKTFTG